MRKKVVRMAADGSEKVFQMRPDLTPEKIQQFMSALSNHGSDGKHCLDLVINKASCHITFQALGAKPENVALKLSFHIPFTLAFTTLQ